MQILSVQELTKTIRKKSILRGISFAIEEGESVGLVGINGAGKSSILKCICGLWHYNGSVCFEGKQIRENYAHFAENSGIVVEYPSLFLNLSLKNNIEYFSTFYKADCSKEALRLAEMLHLSDALNEKIKNFSSGMKQKACLLIALMKKPSLLLLDEPTAMLDPKSAIEIRTFISTIRQERKITLFVSSHNLQEVESLCERVLMIKQGKIVNDLSLNGQAVKKNYTFRFQTAEVAELAMQQADTRFNIKQDGGTLYLYATATELKDFIQQVNPDFIDLSITGGLEKIFLDATHR